MERTSVGVVSVLSNMSMALAWFGTTLQVSGCGTSSSGPGGPSEVKITVGADRQGGGGENAPLVAFQDGDKPWAALAGVGGVYQAMTSGEAYGVFVGCRVDSVNVAFAQLRYYTTSDTAEIDIPHCHPVEDSVQLSIGVLGIATGELAGISATGLEYTVGHIITQNGTQTLALPGGPREVLVHSFAEDATGNVTPHRWYRSNQPASTSYTVDLGVDGLQVQTPPLTVHGLADGEQLLRVSGITTAVGNYIVAQHHDGSVRPTSYEVPDRSQIQPGDLLSVQLTGSLAGSPSVSRSATTFSAAAVAITVDLPSPWTGPLPTVQRTAGSALSVTLPRPTDDEQYAMTFLSDFGGSSTSPIVTRIGEYVVSAAYLEHSSGVFTPPDLSQLVGWAPEMAFAANDFAISWTIGRAAPTHGKLLTAKDGETFAEIRVDGTLAP